MDINEEKLENTPTGGALVGKKDGQTIIHDKGTMSGYLVGKLHKDGGIKAVNKSTGQPLEMQGGEVVITAPAVSDTTKREFEGKMMTNREILSKINSDGGGVSFADGGDIPAKINISDKEYEYGGKMVHDSEIAHRLGMNSTLKKGKQQFTSGDSTYNVDAIYNAIKKGKLRLKTKEVETFPMKYPVYDKKYSETVKTDFRKPNGITVLTESGEEVLIDGNHRMNNAYLKGKQTMKTYYVEDPKQISKFIKKNKFELGGEAEKEKTEEDYGKQFDSEKYSPVYYREKTGNILLPKNKIYFWVYDIPNAIEKLNNKEFDFLFFPFARKYAQFDKGFVPPLKQVWTKKYQKANKGAEHLIGIIECFFSEAENKLYVQMMTVRPDFRRRGLNSFMVNTVRTNLGLSKEDVIFVDATKEGKQFEDSGKFNDGGHLSKGKSLKQIAEMHNVSLEHINEQLAKGLEVEKEHFSDFKERTRVAKDHLVENPNYYTILEKAGLKRGGRVGKEDLVKDAKDGNTPARDLNNYNDLLDVQADGAVGGDSGINMDGALATVDSGAVSSFAKGGVTPYDANSAGDSVPVLNTGGGLGLPKVAYVVVVQSGDSLRGLTGKKFDSYIEFAESVEDDYKKIGKKVRSWVNLTAYDENDKALISVTTYISDQKNTVKNFNPLTGNYNNLEKSLTNSKPRLFGKYDWQDWLLSKVRPSSVSSQVNNTSASSSPMVEKINFGYKSKTLGVGLSLALCPYDVIVNLREFANGDYEDVTIQPTGINVNQKPKSIDVSTQTFKDMVYQNDKVAEVDIMSNLEFTLFPDLDFMEFIRSKKCVAKPNKSSGSFDFANTKIWIGENPELSAQIQELAFKDGYEWANGGGTRPTNTDQPALVFTEFGLNRKITYRADRDRFDEVKDTKEVTVEDIFGVKAQSSMPFDFTATKIDVSGNSELSLKVQKRAFELGWEWENGGGKVLDYHSFNYLYFTKTSISYGNSLTSFQKSPKREIKEQEIFGGATGKGTHIKNTDNEVQSVLITYKENGVDRSISALNQVSLLEKLKRIWFDFPDLKGAFVEPQGRVSVLQEPKQIYFTSQRLIPQDIELDKINETEFGDFLVSLFPNLWWADFIREPKSKTTQLPMYYEFIGTSGEDFTKGRIYLIVDPKNIDSYNNFYDNVGDKNGFGDKNSRYFIPSTEEAFISQNSSASQPKTNYKINSFKVDAKGSNFDEVEVNNIYQLMLALDERKSWDSMILLKYKTEKGGQKEFGAYFVDKPTMYYQLKRDGFNINYLIEKLNEWFPDLISDEFIDKAKVSTSKFLLTDLSKTKIKIIDPEMSKRVQERAFELGWKWTGGSIKISNTNAKYLFFYSDKDFTHSDNIDLFNNSDFKEIFADDLFDSTSMPIKDNSVDLVRLEYEINGNKTARSFRTGVDLLKEFSKIEEYCVKNPDESVSVKVTAESVDKIGKITAKSNNFNFGEKFFKPRNWTYEDTRKLMQEEWFNDALDFNYFFNYAQLNNIKPIDLADTKIWIGNNPELSKKVQEKAFELGWGWSDFGKGKEVQYTEMKSLYFTYNNAIQINSGILDKDAFDNESEKEITVEDLLGSQAFSKTSVVPKIAEQEVYNLELAVGKLEKLSSTVVTEYNKDIYEQSLKFLYDTKATYELALKFTPESAFMYERLDIMKKLSDIEKNIKKIEDMKKGGAYYMLAKILEKLHRGENWKLMEQTQDVITNQLPQSEIDVIIRSQKFKNWFGDWEKALVNDEYDNVSKALTNGIPSVYHHGARRVKYTYREVSNGVLYLAENITYALWFSENSTAQSEEGNFLTECFVNIKNPIDLTAFHVKTVDLADLVRYVDAVYPMAKIYDFIPAQVALLIKSNQPTNIKMWAWQLIRSYAKFVNHIKENTPYDGFLYYENNPSDQVLNPKTGEYEENVTKAVAIFKSPQVKVVDAVLFDGGLDDWRFENGGKIKN